MRRILTVSMLCFCIVVPGALNAASDLPSDGTTAPVIDKNAVLARLNALERSALPLDISVSSFGELVDHARRLGLPDTGTAAQLRSRLYSFYGIAPPEPAAGNLVIRIERADAASLLPIEGLERRIVRISGGVVLRVTEPGGAAHEIRANSIEYDRENNAVSASGGVRLTRTIDGAVSIFSGETVVADLDDWTGVFLDGSVTIPSPGGTEGAGPIAGIGGSDGAISIAAESVVKRSGDVLIVSRGRLASGIDPDPHYSIRAGKVWLLGNGDWAVSDAALFVGSIPVLWLPFFYYPNEEIFFHPVLGSRSREGRYLQTTTWLIGEREKTGSAGSFLDFREGGDTYRTQVEGLFFRRRKGTAPDPQGEAGSASPEAAKDPSFLKLMIDLYSNLGGFAGVQGAVAENGERPWLSFTTGLGVSRSLFFTENGAYSPYVSQSGWKSVWNRARLGALELPFRFGIELQADRPFPLGSARMRVRADIPFYSDPYFAEDFLGRSDTMDWLKLLSDDPADTVRPSVKSGLVQSIGLSGDYSRPAAGGRPGLSVSLTQFAGKANWYSRTALPLPEQSSGQTYLDAADPGRTFFYPDTLRFIDVAGVVRGTLAGRKPGAVSVAGARSDGLRPRTPWFEESSVTAGTPGTTARDDATPGRSPGEDGAGAGGEGASSPESGKAVEEGTIDPLSVRAFRKPPLAARRAVTAEPGATGQESSLEWRIAPAFFFEDKFASDRWRRPEDIDWSLYYSLLSYRVTGSINARASLFGGAGTLTAGLGTLVQNQVRPYLNDPRADTTTVHPLVLSDYGYRTTRITGTAGLVLSPLSGSRLFSQSTLSYSLSSNVLTRKFTGMSGPGLSGEPVYETTWAGWNAQGFGSHSASVSLVAKPAGMTQQIVLSANLPPLGESYGLQVNLGLEAIKFTGRAGLKRSNVGEPLVAEPVSANVSFTGPGKFRVDSTFVYNPLLGTPDSSLSTVSLHPFGASLLFRYGSGYYIGPSSTWIADGTRTFRPESFSFAFTPAFTSREGDAIAWSVDASARLEQNLVRFSESTLLLSATTKIGIGKGFSLSFSGTSRNASVWRYYAGLFPPSGSFDPSAYGKSIVTDVLESLSIWDPAALRRSLLKLQNLTFSLDRSLQNWDLALSVTGAPLLVKPEGARHYYTMDFSLSFSVKWKDIPEISSSVLADSEGVRY